MNENFFFSRLFRDNIHWEIKIVFYIRVVFN